MSDLVIVGGGGMGRCAADLVDAINRDREPRKEPLIRLVGVVDDGHPDPRLWQERGIEILGTVEHLVAMDAGVEFVVAIAAPQVRRTLDHRLSTTGRRSPVLIHPNVHLGHDVQAGPGTLICSHVSLENHIRLGRHVHINQNSTIGHDSVLADYVTVSPLSAVSGAVRLEEAAFVGTGAAINQGLTLGAGSTVGSGAAVIGNVAAAITVVGVPARPVGGSASDSDT